MHLLNIVIESSCKLSKGTFLEGQKYAMIKACYH